MFTIRLFGAFLALSCLSTAALAQPASDVTAHLAHGYSGVATDVALSTGGFDMRVGTSVAAGDINGDGAADLAIGVVEEGGKNDGFVCLILGPVPDDAAV